jgi:hypothetical protein
MKKLPKNFGTTVNLQDFYDCNAVCINRLINVYDTIQYVIEQSTSCIKNKEIPEQLSEMREELALLRERRNIVVALINHIDSNIIGERVAFERKELKELLNKNEEEHARLVKELQAIS